MRSRIQLVVAILAATFILIGFSLGGCRTLFGPTPVDELVPSDTAVDLQAYEASMAPEAGSTSVLILGTPHLAQGGGYSSREVSRVAEALSAYKPDMLAVEHLPPDHPRGKGIDYRPNLNLDSLSARWNLPFSEADSLRRANRQSDGWPERPCRLVKAYALNYDLANAHYYTELHDCPEIHQSQSERLRAYMGRLSQGETARVGYPIAQSNGIRRLVSFDYRGADVRWFIQPALLDAVKSGKVWAIWSFWPVVPTVGSTYQEERAHRDYEDCYTAELRFDNSPQHIGLQYWYYEEEIRSIDWEGVDMGARQVERYWRRNQKMFKRMQDAIENWNAKRVLVIVGSGHKYFLDELVREAGYRWVDPRNWLPESCSGNRGDEATE